MLVGLVLGSVLASLFFARTIHRARYFGVLQVLLGLVVLLLMMLPSDIWRRLGEEWWIYAVLLLPPAVLGGASFPLAVRMVVEEASAASGGTGKIAAVNTLGGHRRGVGGRLCGPAILRSGEQPPLYNRHELGRRVRCVDLARPHIDSSR